MLSSALTVRANIWPMTTNGPSENTSPTRNSTPRKPRKLKKSELTQLT